MTELGALLLPVVPLLGLLTFLLLGRYPGCEAIVRLSERIAAARRARPESSERPRLPKAARSFAAAGGLLIALGIARRPPPLAA
jgi:hypothetical protein